MRGFERRPVGEERRKTVFARDKTAGGSLSLTGMSIQPTSVQWRGLTAVYMARGRERVSGKENRCMRGHVGAFIMSQCPERSRRHGANP